MDIVMAAADLARLGRHGSDHDWVVLVIEAAVTAVAGAVVTEAVRLLTAWLRRRRAWRPAAAGR